MAKFYSGITTGPTLDSMLASGSEFGIFPSQDIDCANINASGIHTVGGFFYPNGGIKDSSNSTGTSGKVLSSTGSGLAWIDPSEGSTTNAINVGTNLNTTNSDQFVAFMGTSSGNNPVRVDADLKYNPSTNLLKVGNVELPNLGEFTLGGNQELKMFHKDDTNDVRVEVESNTNYILLTKNFDLKNAAGNKAAITANESGGVPEVRLHHDGNERLKTTNDGVTITGDLTVTDIIANGNIDLGSDGNDTLTVSAKVDSDIIPSGTTRDLGSNANRWRNLYIKTIKDKDNESGTSGQVLSSTGTELDWINIGDVAAGSAAQVAVSDESTDTTCFPLFATGSTGNQSPKSGSNLTFNSADGTLSATTFSGSGASLTNIPSGQLSGALPAIDGSNLTGLSDNNTTYDLLVGSSSGDVTLTLDASEGDDDTIQIGAGTNISFAGVSATGFTINATNTNTQLSNEQVQDIVGGMVSGNTESGITVTYQDSDGTLDFSVSSQTDQNFTTALKDKLDGIAESATNVTNNNQLTNGAGYTTFDGAYSSLSGTPTIPTNNNQLSNGAGYVTSSGNTIIGTDADINTSGATVIDQLNMTDGVITSHSTRTLTLANLGFTGQTNGHVRRVREVANSGEASRGTNSTSFATHISTTFTSVPSDSRFLVFVNFAIRSSSSNNNRKCEARVSVSGGGVLNSFTKSTALNSYTEDNKFHFMEFDTSSNTSNRTYSLQYRSNHVNEGCSIRHASLVVVEFKPN